MYRGCGPASVAQPVTPSLHVTKKEGTIFGLDGEAAEDILIGPDWTQEQTVAAICQSQRATP